MVSSPFQIQQKQTRTKRCYTSIRGALASPRQVGTAQVPMHRHRPLATWFSLWSDEVYHLVWDQFTIVSDSSKLDQLLSSNIRSPSVHTQSRTWVTDYLIACLPRQEDYTWDLTSKLCFPFIGISLTFPRGDAAFITPPGLSSPKPPTKSIGNWVLHSLWKNYHIGVIRSIFPDDEVSLSITFFSFRIDLAA